MDSGSFTGEVLTWKGLVTHYVQLFIELGRRRVWLGEFRDEGVGPIVCRSA